MWLNKLLDKFNELLFGDVTYTPQKKPKKRAIKVVQKRKKVKRKKSSKSKSSNGNNSDNKSQKQIGGYKMVSSRIDDMNPVLIDLLQYIEKNGKKYSQTENTVSYKVGKDDITIIFHKNTTSIIIELSEVCWFGRFITIVGSNTGDSLEVSSDKDVIGYIEYDIDDSLLFEFEDIRYDEIIEKSSLLHDWFVMEKEGYIVSNGYVTRDFGYLPEDEDDYCESISIDYNKVVCGYLNNDNTTITH